ncbi:MAG: hypothetical protein WCR55_09750 [Lentisphaerota bacterium]
MMKTSKLFTFISLSLLLLCAGCSIFPKNENIPVTYFDIGAPGEIEGLKQSPQVDIQDVKTMDPYNERMVFRVSETHIEIDEYNRWASSPDEMIRKYFVIAFNQNDLNKVKLQGDNRLELYVQILCLESDLTKKTVKVTLAVQIKKSLDGNVVYSEILSEQQSVDNVTAEKFAETVKNLIDKMLISLSSNLIQVSKTK